jgi:hypothetical protein
MNKIKYFFCNVDPFPLAMLIVAIVLFGTIGFYQGWFVGNGELWIKLFRSIGIGVLGIGGLFLLLSGTYKGIVYMQEKCKSE